MNCLSKYLRLVAVTMMFLTITITNAYAQNYDYVRAVENVQKACFDFTSRRTDSLDSLPEPEFTKQIVSKRKTRYSSGWRGMIGSGVTAAATKRRKGRMCEVWVYTGVENARNIWNNLQQSMIRQGYTITPFNRGGGVNASRGNITFYVKAQHANVFYLRIGVIDSN